MNNGEWMVKNGYDFTKLGVTLNGEESFESYSYKIFLDKKHIATITTNDSSCLKAMLLWLNQKHVEMILSDAERQYLAAIIRPFRDDVQYIAKYSGRFKAAGEFEKIIVNYNYKPLNSVFYFDLPPFEKGIMYKGMETYKKYTIEELGL